jgi:hypothetical protein
MMSPSANPSVVNNGFTAGEMAAGTTFFIFFAIWVLAGLVAFIYSLFCFGRSGTTLDKFIGLLIAFFTGPFYFLYLRFNGAYCL